MEEFADFKKLDNIKFYRQHGYGFISDNNAYFREKEHKIKMLDENHVIKLAKGNLEYYEKLKELKIPNVVTPDQIYLAPSKQIQDYYIVSKYITDAKSLQLLCSKNISLEEFLKIIIKIMHILERCHENNFYIIDINTLNILIDKEMEPYLIDFDTSCFIKDNNLYASCKYISSYQEDDYIKLFTDRFYKGFKSENPKDFQNKFMLLDKIELITLITDYLFKKLGIDVAQEELITNSYVIHKLGLPKELEIKMLNMLYGQGIEEEDYLYDELEDFASSRYVRKRKFK